MTKNKKENGASEQLAPSKLNRKCISCGKLLARKKFIRILKEHKTNNLVINPDNKTFGRSAYICYNKECLKIAIKKNRFEKALKTKIDNALEEKLKKMIN